MFLLLAVALLSRNLAWGHGGVTHGDGQTVGTAMAAATIDSDGVVPMASVADAVGDVDDHAAATREQEDDAERALRGAGGAWRVLG